jgi:crossover junction endodeoxyribonuclease RuvC
MRILGIDPGTATVGFGVIEMTGRDYKPLDFGHISTSKTLSAPQRLNEIANDLKALCDKWKPNVCAVEEIFFSKNVTTAIQVAQARGVILQTLNAAGYPIHEYNPMQIKLAITGDGRAVKSQVQKMVTILLKLKEIPKPDDAADALAIALCFAHTPIHHLSHK